MYAIHTVALTSGQHYGHRAPARPVGEILRLVPQAVRRSIRMAIQGRSSAKGARPRWLEAAAEVRFLEYGGEDRTILKFEAPRLVDAAPVLFEQRTFWPMLPDEQATGFDLLAAVLNDLSAGNDDSDRFDRGLLGQIGQFRQAVEGGFQELRLEKGSAPSSAPAVLNADVLTQAKTLWNATPPTQPVRVSGKLDMLRESTQSFALKLAQGEEVRGGFPEGDLTAVVPLFGKQVLVLGKAVFRASGRLLRIDATSITAASESDRFFSQLPAPHQRRLDVRRLVKEQADKGGFAAIFGKWPGDETDEQIARALEELS